MNPARSKLDFDRIRQAARNAAEQLVMEWLPDGRREGRLWSARNPTRNDGSIGSFKIDLAEGWWKDFATDDKGGDLISLHAYLSGCEYVQAARGLAERLGIAPLTAESPAPLKARRTPWGPILPVPAEAAPPPKAHIKRGKPEAVWCYRNRDGAALGYVYRFRTSDGGKEVLPCVYARHDVTGAHEWRWMAFSEPRPLYGLDRLRDDKPVLIVEGEKCADAAWSVAEIRERYDVLTWPGGGKAVAKIDWSPLAGRNVVIWPDCDAQKDDAGELLPEAAQPGVKAAYAIAQMLRALDCRLRVVQIPAPGEKPSGWDIADAIAEGWDGAALFSFLRDHQASPKLLVVGGAKPDTEWRKRLLRKDSGALIDCRENLFLMLDNHPALAGLVGLDEFAYAVKRRRPAPWRAQPGEWDETDDFQLGLWLAQNEHLIVKSLASIADSVHAVAARHPFHPVREYLEATEWDRVARLAYWLEDGFGCERSEYAQLIGRLFFLTLVARVYRPGCVMKHMLILEGEQSRGKSTALRIIGGDWFADTPIVIGDKDAYVVLRGKLLYEISELDAFSRSEITRVKAFVSSPVDYYRAPYERRPRDWPRQCAFAGTTNQYEYLKDSTGNVRFWPMRIETANFDWLAAQRDQLFAEALHAFRAGELWYPTARQQEELISYEQEMREIPDPWLEMIGDFLAGRTSVTLQEILEDCLRVEAQKIDGARQMATRVGIAMHRLKWEKRRKRVGPGREYFYVKRAAVKNVSGGDEPL